MSGRPNPAGLQGTPASKRYPLVVRRGRAVVHVGTVVADGPREALQKVLASPAWPVDPKGWYQVRVGTPGVPQDYAVASARGDELQRTGEAAGELGGLQDAAVDGQERERVKQEALRAAVDLLGKMGPPPVDWDKVRELEDAACNGNVPDALEELRAANRERERKKILSQVRPRVQTASAAGTGMCRHPRVRRDVDKDPVTGNTQTRDMCEACGCMYVHSRPKGGTAPWSPEDTFRVGGSRPCRHQLRRLVLRSRWAQPWRPGDPADSFPPPDIDESCADCGATLK